MLQREASGRCPRYAASIPWRRGRPDLDYLVADIRDLQDWVTTAPSRTQAIPELLNQPERRVPRGQCVSDQPNLDTDDPEIAARKRALSSYGRLWATLPKNPRMTDRAEATTLQELTAMGTL